MRDIWKIARLVWSAAPWAMTRGALLTITVLLMGAALLGLSGWFITATGLAGLAGLGIAFDVFRPSAGVRFLALGRAGARYAERLLTHDATLRALSALRIDLMRRQSRLPFAALQKLRGPLALTRITADVDALDGVVLRLVLPVAAALVTHLVVFAMLVWLVDLRVAATIGAGYLAGGAVILARLGIATFAPSAAAERTQQALRRETIDMMRGQTDLLVHGRMAGQAAMLRGRDAEARAALGTLDRLDRRAGVALSSLVTLVSGSVLLLGGALVAAGDVGPALAALGFFVALALAETVHPLRRGIAEIGRMRDAARRVLEAPDVPPRREAGAAPAVSAPALCVTDLAYRRDGAAQPLFSGLSFTVSPGETLAITGPSGRGKSTLLALLAGLEPPSAGSVRLGDVPLSDWPEHALRDTLTLVPQRSALLSGTILENLRLARADVTEEEARAVLRATALDGVIAARGGLDSTLHEGGRGLSGGETRRLVLARALLRRPGVLLLDEPTEGLDDATARRVLSGVRSFLPDAAIVTASHRTAETAAADRVLDLKRHIQKSRFY